MIIKDNMANMCAKVTSTYMEFTLAFGPKPEFSFSFKYCIMLICHFCIHISIIQTYVRLCKCFLQLKQRQSRIDLNIQTGYVQLHLPYIPCFSKHIFFYLRNTFAPCFMQLING
nr:MAG TPA: hypothetical protein [Caudoviricetes sp.]